MKHLNRLTLLVLAAFCLIGCEQTKLQMNVIGTWRVVESTDQTDVHKIWKFNADKTCIVNGWQQLSEVRGEQFEYAVFESEGQNVLQLFQRAYDNSGQVVAPKNEVYGIDSCDKTTLTIHNESKTLTLEKIEK